MNGNSEVVFGAFHDAVDRFRYAVKEVADREAVEAETAVLLASLRDEMLRMADSYELSFDWQDESADMIIDGQIASKAAALGISTAEAGTAAKPR